MADTEDDCAPLRRAIAALKAARAILDSADEMLLAAHTQTVIGHVLKRLKERSTARTQA